MRDTVKQAAQGNTKEALKELNEHGKIKIYNSPQEARSKLVNDYINENADNQKGGIILTNHKADAAKINQEVHEKLQEQGKIKEDKLEVDNGSRKISLAEGDRVMFTRNDYNLDVRNGQRGTVEEIDKKTNSINVKMDNGQDKTVNTEKYNHIEYGWASTTHKAQGATAEKAYVYGHTQEPMASQQSTYVQISRAKEETKIYAVNGERSVERPWQSEKQTEKESSLVTGDRERNAAINELEKSWSKDSAKETTLDYAPQKETALEKEIVKPKGKDFGLEMGR
jgi:ATP-dependent exoDNAse (exonuclease V) alpha subunit